MMLDPHTVVGLEVREICGLRVCFVMCARSFFVLFVWVSQVDCLKMLSQEGQAESLPSSEEELGWRASVLTACITPGSYGLVDIFPSLCAA